MDNLIQSKLILIGDYKCISPNIKFEILVGEIFINETRLNWEVLDKKSKIKLHHMLLDINEIKINGSRLYRNVMEGKQ